jgi:hypothetical protein
MQNQHRPESSSGVQGEKKMFQSPIDPRLLQEQADLNYSFIELISRAHREQPDTHAEGVLGLREEWVATIARMRHRKRREMAECTFALYGLHLHDARFWSAVRPYHIPDDYSEPSPRGGADLEQRVLQFSLTALMHAWHVASGNAYGARLLLGMPQTVAERIVTLPVTLIEKVALQSPALLQARLAANRRFWPDLIACVDQGSQQQRFAAKLLGAQLIAASSVLVS